MAEAVQKQLLSFHALQQLPRMLHGDSPQCDSWRGVAIQWRRLSLRLRSVHRQAAAPLICSLVARKGRLSHFQRGCGSAGEGG